MGPVVVTNLRTAGMVIPGRNCQFECGIEPNPHNVITWLLNNQAISPEKFQVIIGQELTQTNTILYLGPDEIVVVAVLFLGDFC